MKKSILPKILIIILILWTICFTVDYRCVKKNKTPVFAIKTSNYWDGGTHEYYGIGYKIIKYHYFNDNYPKEDGYIEYSEIGTYFLKYKRKDTNE